jgi:hypothetical protein
MEEELIPNNLYLLKWSTVRPNGQIHNMIVLKAEFIKFFNNLYCEQHKNYIFEDTAPPPELIGPILTEDENYVEYPFEDPLYPYSHFFKHTDNGCNLGLFKIISIENSIFKGIPQPFRNNNPYNFVTIQTNTLVNTSKEIREGTLMWVDLNKSAIRPLINKLKLLQHKAVDNLSLPEDIQNYKIKPMLGGNKRKKSAKLYKNTRFRKKIRKRKITRRK